MEIYLVRHGETDGNVGHRHQVEKTPLSPVGKEQARKVAEIIKEYKPTHLVTSNLVRAIETARVIGDVCDLVPDTTDHFVELNRPQSLYGQRHRSLPSILFYTNWYFGTKWAANKGGESYIDFRTRIESAKTYLEQFPDDARVVVVSHSVFMSLFSAHACNGKMLSPLKALLAFKDIITMPNTHIMPVLYEAGRHGQSDQVCNWTVEKIPQVK